MSRTSIELGWLSRRDKQISLPRLVFGSYKAGQGACYKPQWSEVWIDGIGYGLDKGLIIVDPAKAFSVGSVLAHEWRHHWQYLNGWKLNVIPHDFSDPKRRRQTIRSYYRSQPFEMDALRFELAVAPCEDARQSFDFAK